MSREVFVSIDFRLLLTFVVIVDFLGMMAQDAPAGIFDGLVARALQQAVVMMFLDLFPGIDLW